MHIIKKLFTKATGYWMHKQDTLPVGADLTVDIRNRINYKNLDVIFDVGANTGQTWREMRSQFALAKIYCFEPVSATFDELTINAAVDSKTVLENFAFGERNGEMDIRLFDEYSYLNSLKEAAMNHISSARIERIKINTVDNYCRQNSISKIDLLKIDTEGYELNVLQGAHEMLSAAKISLIYCEVGFLKANERNTNFSDLSEWLAKYGYYFFGMYQLMSFGWNKGEYLGNALFAHKDIYKS